MSYECHITTTVAHAQLAGDQAAVFGWKTSEIKRDPILGDGSHFYLTKHHASFTELYSLMELHAARMRQAGIPIVRLKIEHIVYDTKTGVGVVK